MLVWTGDITPHNIYEYSLEEVKTYTEHFSNWMKDAFPHMKLYPVQGNHDFGIANSQSFHPKDPMIPFTLEQWAYWLDEAAQKEFSRQGYYSMPLKLNDGRTLKARVIALNTEAGY